MISSPFWGHLQPHLHLLLVPLLPVSEMDNLQNQKCKTNPQHCDPCPNIPQTADLEKLSPHKAGTKDDKGPTLRPWPPVRVLCQRQPIHLTPQPESHSHSPASPSHSHKCPVPLLSPGASSPRFRTQPWGRKVVLLTPLLLPQLPNHTHISGQVLPCFPLP